ncbi:MAG: alpha/beta hydrolase [Alphaproteobacteria bacterium]|jgi:uncharacterized protein|nr:alpha/beta hydrolase [Alphaproteobacteria bacterium]MBT4019290.1 alpha/beta hydrolase [Alphaproteobacteria bacterium]MBT4966541.1 alpha/beta hydrolase [Alphaproteobacteria bacterium]MBT5159904.1 alpha/beta hydrolase [Alphaproteobacteria bacterium]MBT5917656.1 alpha/beta hydrolase [Alphaproteobacteria bacterium]
MGFGLRAALYVIAAYALFTAAVYLAQRRMMYFPATYLPTPQDAGLKGAETVTLRTADGLQLVAWYVAAKPAADLSTIVYFHGNAGNIAGRTFRIRQYLDAGYGVLLVEYRGYGGNPGKPTEQGLYDDGRAAMAFLEQRGVAAADTVLFGESLGSGVAVQLATEYETSALVLEAPYTSTVDVAAEAYWFLPVRSMMKDRFDSLGKISKISAPVLVLHGEHDRTIPVAHGRKLLSAANEPRRGVFFDHGGHNDLPNHGSDAQVLRFLADLVSGKIE